jgi:hypothetical protein
MRFYASPDPPLQYDPVAKKGLKSQSLISPGVRELAACFAGNAQAKVQKVPAQMTASPEGKDLYG